MSSFFLKGKPRTATKRKFQKPDKKDKKSKASKAPEPESEEEIDSDDEEERTIAGASRKFNFEDEEDGLVETAQDKRLRLAKKYLKGVEEAERERAQEREDEAADLEGNVSAALREDYLESIGKLYREVADSYRGFNLDRAVTLRHKQQNLSPTCLCLTEDDRFLYVANKNGIVVRWNVTTGEKLAATKPQRTAVQALAISHDLKFLAVADGTSEIKVLHGETLEKVNSLSGHSDVVTGVVFRRNTHTLYSCSKDRTVKVWSLDEMLYVETLYGHQSPVTSIDALSRERAITSGGSDASIRIWKIVEESQLVYQLPPATVDSIECVRLIGDEHFVSCGTDGSLSVWSSGRKKPLDTVRLAHGKTSGNGEPNWISAVASLLNTDVIASGSCDGWVRLWRLVGSGKSIRPLMEIPVEGFVNGLAFSSDGKRLFVCVGQEHRLGRWWTLKQAKNRTIVVPLEVVEEEDAGKKGKKKRKNLSG